MQILPEFHCQEGERETQQGRAKNRATIWVTIASESAN